MKRTLLLLALAAPLLSAAVALGQPAAETIQAGSIETDIGAVVDAVRSGSAIAIAAAVIMLLVDLLKIPQIGGLFERIPKRWRIALPIILSGVAGILSNILGGIPWQEAVLVGLFAGPTAVFAHEAVVEAILGHSRSRRPELLD